MSEPTSTPDAAALRREFWDLPDEAFVDRPTIAAVFYESGANMEARAIRGGGPPYIRIGRRCLYQKRAALEWAAEHGRAVTNTAQLHTGSAA